MKIYENLDLQDLEGEIWKVIEEYPDYQVSNFGRVKSFKHDKIDGKIRKQIKSCKYFYVNLSKNGISKSKRVHRLVHEAHIEKLEDGYDSHHINKNKEDNFVENLETKEHGKHIGNHNKKRIVSKETKIKISKKMKGKKHPNFKLTNQKLIDIRIDIEKGDLIYREMAKKHGVCQATISNIKNNKIFYLKNSEL